jgi:Acyl-CoA reductase (LuxC)
MQRHPRCTGKSVTRIQRILPALEPVEASGLVASLGEVTWSPFADAIVDFAAQFSRRLARRAGSTPELQALAFWMRRAAVTRLAREYEVLKSPRLLLIPRGLVFHVPPANVDTMFVYSWLLSALVGNRNIVRLPSESTPTTTILIEVLGSLLDESQHAQVRATNAFVGYGHERDVTSEFSAACDLRVIWGGDATVSAIRESSLGPHATDLTFPDRLSFALMKTVAFAGLNGDQRDELATRFFNDSYWFDQLGCSSPRVLVWVGEPPADVDHDFYQRLLRVAAAKGYAVDTATALNKIAYAHRSVLDLGVIHVSSPANELTVLELADPLLQSGDYAGAGTFLNAWVPSLRDLTPQITRKHQTAAHFGFGAGELRDFAIALNGRGINRFVPFGEALQFDRVWDGRDLLQELSRRVVLQD